MNKARFTIEPPDAADYYSPTVELFDFENYSQICAVKQYRQDQEDRAEWVGTHPDEDFPMMIAIVFLYN